MNNITRRRSINFFLFILLMMNGFSVPLNPPSQHDDIPLLIDSDSTQMDFKSGINTYDGHVTATHGDSRLTGDKVMTYRNKDNKIEKIITTGNPATIHSAEDKNQQPVDATALTITFHPITHDVLLEGNASATQGKNIIHAPAIQYNTESKIMKAKSTKQFRTHILVYNDDRVNPSNASTTGNPTP